MNEFAYCKELIELNFHTGVLIGVAIGMAVALAIVLLINSYMSDKSNEETP